MKSIFSVLDSDHVTKNNEYKNLVINTSKVFKLYLDRNQHENIFLFLKASGLLK